MTNRQTSWRLALLAAGLVMAAPAGAQQAPVLIERDGSPATPIDAATRARVVKALAAKLEAGYVFPDTATKLAAAVREKLANKGYETCVTGQDLARQLTADLQSIAKDKHLHVRFPTKTPPGQPDGEPTPELRKKMEEMRRKLDRKRNAGFERVERLPGNIGLLDLRGFADAGGAAETAVAAMNFLADTDALIIDLRRNGGGSPQMVQLLCSYLLPADKPVLLNTMHWRKGDRTEEFWTLKDVAGRRYLDRPVYILTGRRTFSAAEEFAYDLKNLKRATLIGATTGGGANPGGPVPLADQFAAFIPAGRAINPVTKTNWEGTGVKPDVEVAADKAPDVAREMAVKRLRERLTDEDAREFFERDLRGPERERGPR
jgi:hypothetical protein